MFGRTKAKLSLLFNRDAIITHRFEQWGLASLYDSMNGDYEGDINVRHKAWAEAKPIGNDQYIVTRKDLVTHNWPFSAKKSMLYKNKLDKPLNRAEAVAYLKTMEAQFIKEGYGGSLKQPFKNKIYANQKSSAPKTA